MLPVVTIVFEPKELNNVTTLLSPYELFASTPHVPSPRNTLFALPLRFIVDIFPKFDIGGLFPTIMLSTTILFPFALIVASPK